MTNQAEKYHINIAGEFYVAAELQRRGVSAAVTYGNAKKADVIAFTSGGERAVVIEVKSTAQPKWIIGSYVPEEGKNPWVLVHVPSDATAPPSYYILTQSEIRAICVPISKAYTDKYKQKHGVDYGDKPGVVSLTKDQAKDHKDAWDKILKEIET
jgi:hypothetical protein